MSQRRSKSKEMCRKEDWIATKIYVKKVGKSLKSIHDGTCIEE
jgi:hypothetical protein